jgi:signal transduction histidine kinase
VSLAAAADIVALFGFGAAVYFVVRIPRGAPGLGRYVKGTLLAATAVYFLVSASNTLEHTGISSFYDVYEDFIEVLFVPLVAWAIYSRISAQRLLEAQRAEEDIRREHELLVNILNTTPAGILVALADGTVTTANEVAEEMVALALDGQLDLGEIVRSAPVSRMSTRLGTGDTSMYVAISSTPLAAQEGAPVSAVISLSDVTDRVGAEARAEEYRRGLEDAIDRRTGELLEANRQLQKAGDTNQQFFTKMSHELRTPLNAIIGFSEIILRGLSGPVSPDQRKQLEMVRDAGHQLLDTVNDVLEISRIESGYRTVSVVSFDLNARMSVLTESMSGVALMQGVDLACSCEGGSVVSTDPDKLDQIVRNLISNAIKFTDPGGRVRVSVTHDREYATIAVADSGIGIAEEDQERIFRAFEQVENPDRIRPVGTGLGLLICRELSAALGCGITVESRPGVGSTFTVVVPQQFPGHLVIL